MKENLALQKKLVLSRPHRAALDINPRHANACVENLVRTLVTTRLMSHYNYACLLDDMQRYDDAEEHYGRSPARERHRPHRTALEINPRYAKACVARWETRLEC